MKKQPAMPLGQKMNQKPGISKQCEIGKHWNCSTLACTCKCGHGVKSA